MDLSKATRSVGDPQQIRRDEQRRANHLRQIQEQFHRTEELLEHEVAVRDQMDKIRDEEHSASLGGIDPEGIKDEVGAMQGEHLGRFETEQYTEIGKLEAELNQIQETERALKLHVANKDSVTRSNILGGAKNHQETPQERLKSRQQRMEELVAEKARRGEVLKRQKAHLQHEKETMDVVLAKLKSGESVPATRSVAMEALEYSRAYMPGSKEAEQYDMAKRTPPPPSAYKEEQAALLSSKRAVDELVEKYHADRRNLQRLRNQQQEVQNELQDLQQNAWKPALNLIAGKAEDKERATERMAERKRDLDAARARMELVEERKAREGEQAQTRPSPRKEKKKSPRKGAADAANARQLSSPTGQQHHHQQQPNPPGGTDSLQDEIRRLKQDYVNKGGNDPGMLEAIASLERESGHPRVQFPPIVNQPPPSYQSQPQFPYAGNPFAAPGPPPYYGQDAGMMLLMQQQQQQHAMMMQRQQHEAQQQQQQQAEAKAIEAEIERERTEHERLRLEMQRQRAPPAAERSQREGGRGGLDDEVDRPRDRAGAALPLEEEEEELRQLALFPKDSDIYRLRKKHLEEMVKLKYEIQQLQQQTAKDKLAREVEDMKKEHERREWMQLQQQQLLEAKYRKHMAREKPLAAMRDGSHAGAYAPELGFILYFDYVLGLPSKVVHQMQIVYGFFEGVNATTPAKSLPMIDVEKDGGIGHRGVLAMKRQFQKVPAIDRYKLLLEVQSITPATNERGPRTLPVAWTLLRLFRSDGQLNTGLWRIPTFLPPVRSEMALEEAMSLHQLRDLELFLRLVPSQQTDVHDKFAVNPDLTQMQYRYQDELRPPHLPAPYPQMATTDQRTPVDSLRRLPTDRLQAQPSARKSDRPKAVTANVHVLLDGVVGALHGHQHCQNGGHVYLRLTLADVELIGQLPTTFSAHKDDGLASTGLRFKTRVHDNGEAEYDFRQAQDSWCTASVLDVGGTRTEFKEGCHLDNIPCKGSSVIIVEAFQEKLKEDEDEDEDAEKDTDLRTEPGPDDVLIAWTTIQLFKEFEPTSEITGLRVGPWAKAGLELRIGHHKLHLLAPPVDRGSHYEHVRDEQKRLGARLGVGERAGAPLMSHLPGSSAVVNLPLPILEVAVQEAQQPVSMVQRFRNRVNQVKLMKRMGRMLDQKVDEIFNYRDLDAWISVPDSPVSSEPFAVDDGFDLYIDGARYLPDNVSLSAVTCFATGADLTVYAKTTRVVDVRSQSVCCPMFLCRKEVRKDPKRDWDPTLTILIELNGLEKHFSGEKPSKVSIVGFAVINAFIDLETGEQPKHKDVKNFTLNEGAFQVSVYRSGLTKGERMSKSALDDELRRLCTSVLVRFVKAPRTADGLGVQSSRDLDLGEDGLAEVGLLVRPLPYKSGAYASESRSSPLDLERFLYPSRLLHDKKSVSAAGALVEATGSKLMPEQEEALKDHDIFEHERFGQELKSLQREVRKLFHPDTSSPAGMIDHRFVLPHVPSKGFMVAVDGVDNMPPHIGFTWVTALVSAFPQGIFYNSEGAITSDITLIHQLDYNADAARPRWTDGWNWYPHQEPNINGHLLMIIDVRLVVNELRPDGNIRKAKKLPKAQMTQFGFAFLPVWGVGGSYTLSGSYRLPIFATGPPPSPDDELDEFGMPIDSQNWGPTTTLLDNVALGRRGLIPVLEKQMQEDRIHMVDGASVLVRVVDGLRMGEFNVPFSATGDPKRVDDVYLPPDKLQDYAPSPLGRTLKDVLKKDVKNFDKNSADMLKLFMDSYDIPDKARDKTLPPDYDPTHRPGANSVPPPPTGQARADGASRQGTAASRR